MPPAVEVRSPNRWTAREVPKEGVFGPESVPIGHTETLIGGGGLPSLTPFHPLGYLSFFQMKFSSTTMILC